MAATLRWTDLVCLGIGGMLGAGVFVSTGRAARDFAGPAVVLSYAIAGLCALLSAFCYTEFAVDLPLAGGAFSYLRVTLGEFAAFLTGANLLMEYVFSNAAVARSLTAYLGAAIGVETEVKWRITVSALPHGFNKLDPLAVFLILGLTLCICYRFKNKNATLLLLAEKLLINKSAQLMTLIGFSTKNSSKLNMALTAAHVVFVLFIIVMGFWRGDRKNFTRPARPGEHAGGFSPYGIGGVFDGAAAVYLSYIGYDAVSTMAEEVSNPARDIPMGVSGSVAVVTVLYCLMAASMAMLVPYDAIEVESPFSAAFKGSNGWGWVSRLIGAGASFGILTSLLVSMMGQARYLCVIRAGPCGLTAFIALFTDLNVLLNLVTIGTLFVFYMVANAVIYRRYVSLGSTNPWPTVGFLVLFSLSAATFTFSWRILRFGGGGGVAKVLLLSGSAATAAAAVCAFASWVPQARKPELWGVPLMPFVPAISIFLNVFLIGLLDWPSYVRFGAFTALAVVFYLLYGVHASFDAEECGELTAEPSNSFSAARPSAGGGQQ
ncbi:hypothetical protein KSP40_PGU014446 [Platanthera guangdongensis]|uniref:Cationic amino acid transporter C-terminal domain-containing protein n=1 Tax=Platanthera guangdongensis TaxID=2320717 RepID=A0ABR2MK58_9ASPA